MLQPGPNDALSQNFMKLGLLVAEKKRGQTDRHTDRQTEWLLRAPFQGFRIFSFNLSSRIGPIYDTLCDGYRYILRVMVFHCLNTGEKRAVRRALPVFREWKTITSNMYRYKAHRVFYIYFIQHSRRLVVKFLLKTTVVMKKKFLWKTNNWPSYCEFPAGRSTALVNICVRNTAFEFWVNNVGK